MTDSIENINELTLVCRKLGVSRSNGPTEECQGIPAFVLDRPKASAECVALDDEDGREVRQLEHRCYC